MEAEKRPITFAGAAPGASIPLIPDKDDYEDNLFYIYSGPGAKMSVKFSVKPKGKIDLYITEWIFHKVKEL